MFDRIIKGRAFGRSVALAAIIVGCAGAGLSPAAAGECPADQVKANVRAPVTTPGKGVADTVLTAKTQAEELVIAKMRPERLFTGCRLCAHRARLVFHKFSFAFIWTIFVLHKTLSPALSQNTGRGGIRSALASPRVLGEGD